LPACRSDRRMCIVGGRNDATDIMRQFWLGCNLYLKINHELWESAESAGRYEAAAMPPGITTTAGAAATAKSMGYM